MLRALSFMTLFLCFSMSAMATELTVGISGKIAGTESADKTDNVSLSVLNHVLEGLLAFDDDLKIVPMLAESYSVSKDGRTYIFNIRRGVTFHNGAALTAKEVKWSLDYHRDSTRNWGAHCREYIDGSGRLYMRPAKIMDVEVLGRHKVSVTLQSRNALFPTTLATPHCINAILHPSSVDKEGNWIAPVATGPYSFKKLTEEGGAILERNKDYAQASGRPTGLAGKKEALFDRITYKNYESATLLLSAFEKGDIDFALGVPFSAYTASNAALKKHAQIEGTPSWHQLMINTHKVRDVRIRRAMFHALDQKAMAKELFGSEDLANVSAVTRGSHYYTTAQQAGLAADISRAKKMLAQAGYKGEPIELMASEAPYALSLASAEIAARMMRRAGLNIVVKATDWNTHKGSTYLNKGQLSSMPVSGLVDPVQMYGSITGQKQDLSWFMWEDAEADALISGAAMIADHDKKQTRLDRLHVKHTDWVPTIGLFDFPMINFKSSCIEGYRSWGMGLPRFWGVKKSATCQKNETGE